MLEKSAKIYVAGHHGLVGSAIWNNLLQRGYTNLVGRSHKELDLTDQIAVKKFFDTEQPEAVVLAAALTCGRACSRSAMSESSLSPLLSLNRSLDLRSSLVATRDSRCEHHSPLAAPSLRGRHHGQYAVQGGLDYVFLLRASVVLKQA